MSFDPRRSVACGSQFFSLQNHSLVSATIVHHSLHCLDNTGCGADRSVRRDDSRMFACLFQRKNGGLLSDSRNGHCGLGVHRRQWNGGEPEMDLIGFQALAGLGLPSRLARSSSQLVLRASPESCVTSPHAARYFSRFDCTVRLRVSGIWTASRRAVVDHGLVFLLGFDFPTWFTSAEIMALLKRRMQRRRCISGKSAPILQTAPEKEHDTLLGE